MPKYRVWDNINEDEIEALRRNDKWSVFEAESPALAALAFVAAISPRDYVLELINSFEVHVRDRETNDLHVIWVTWGGEVVPVAEDRFRHSIDAMEYTIASAAEAS